MPRKTAEQKQAETRAKLIEAADATFLARGYGAASLDEISDLAGYSTGAIYSNFASKDALFLTCANRRAAEQLRQWDDFLADPGALRGSDGLAKILQAVVPEPRWLKALFECRIAPISPDSRAVLLRAVREWRDLIARVLRAYCESNGHPAPEPLEPVAAMVAGMVDGLIMDSLVDPTTDVAGIFARAVAMLLGAPATADGAAT